MRALIAGGTGLVGFELLKILAKSSLYSEVLVPCRGKLQLEHPKIHPIPIESLADIPQKLGDAKIHHGFCCLGSTIKSAGSRENFEAVDLHGVVHLAGALKERGTQKFLVVSSMGANVTSPFFYNRVKGKMEAAVEKLKFNHLVVFRPSLITGKRKEPRKGERIAEIVMTPLNFLPFKWSRNLAPISAKTIAQGMALKAADFHTGFEILSSGVIRQLKKDPTWRAYKN